MSDNNTTYPGKNSSEVQNSEQKSLSGPKKLIFCIVLILLPILILMFIEMGLRIFDYGGDLDLFLLQESGEYQEYVLNNDFTKRYFFQKGLKTPVPLSQRFSAVKDNSTYRIFCLGASSVQGFPYPPNAAFPAMLQHILSDLHADKKIEVINCGITAITSHSVLDMSREILDKYDPDLLVIYSGHNEFYGVFGQGSNLALFESRTPIQLFLKMQKSELFLLVRNTVNYLFAKEIDRSLAEKSTTLMETMARDQGIRYDSDVYSNTENIFRDNIYDIVESAKEKSCDIILCTLVSNLRDFTPFASLHSVEFNEIDSANWKKLTTEAAEYQVNHQYKEAIETYLQTLDIDSAYAETHYHLAQCYNSIGENQQAKEHFIKAADYDVIRFRAPSSFNLILKQIAGEYSVPVADINQDLTNLSQNRIIGNDLLHEHVHPNQDGYMQISKSIARTMSQNSMISGSWNLLNLPADSVYYARSKITMLDHEIVNYMLFRLTSYWPFHEIHGLDNYRPVGGSRTFELARSFIDENRGSLVELHLEYGNELLDKNMDQEAEAEYEAALAIQPLSQTYNRLGRLFLRNTEIAYRDEKDYDAAYQNYLKGVSWFKEGLKRCPGDVELNFNMALLYFMRNDQLELSEKYFLKVLELKPSHKQASLQLSELYIRLNKSNKAIYTLQKAIERNPDHARFYTDLGIVLMNVNQLEQAKKYLEKAIELDNDLKAKYYLHQLRAKQNNS